MRKHTRLLAFFVAACFGLASTAAAGNATGLMAERTAGEVRLSWQPPEEKPSGIRIYRREMTPPLGQGVTGEDSRGDLLQTLPGDAAAYVDRAVKPGMLYIYRIAFVDADGGEGPASSPVAAILKDETPPEPPGKLTATADEKGRVTLRWKPSPSDDVTQVQVFRRVNASGRWATIGAYRPGTLEATDRVDPRAGYSYAYAVAALDAGGNLSTRSPEVIVRPADTRPPGAPVITGIESREDGSVVVRWSRPGDSDLSAFRLYRAAVDDGPVRMGEVDGNEVEAVDQEATAGIAYRYSVTAVDEAGNESRRSGEVKAFARVPRNVAPGAPGSPTVRKGKSGGIALRWDATDRADLDGWLVYRSPDRETGYVNVSGLLAEPRFTDDTATGGGPFWYRVRALYAGGVLSGPSEPVSGRLKDEK